MSRLLLFIVLLFFAPYRTKKAVTFDGGEKAPPKVYPKDYFRFPLKITPSLAGNFGDLRTNHYHMGVDLRTQQRENLPVVAAADGYVSHIRVEPWGYGHAIYITHPNGYSTVYGHLNTFYDELESYVRKKEYASESWEQDIDFAPGQFPVKKGQFIAWSGNTGGSEGPHLHFEIRDSGLAKGHNKNPLLFGLGIPDHVAPALYRLGVFDRNESIYEHDPHLFALVKKVKGGESYYAPASDLIKVPDGKFCLGVGMEDKMENSFSFGVYKASLTIDGKLKNEFQIEDCLYPDSRYINAGIDYVTRYSGGKYMQLLSRLPGNRSPFYDDAGDGVLQLRDDKIYDVEVKVEDVAGNTSLLRFRIQRDDATHFTRNSFGGDVVKTLVPNKPAEFSNANVQLTWDAKAVYDTVKLRYRNAAVPANGESDIQEIGDYRMPVHTPYIVRIKAKKALSESEKKKTVMVLKSGRRDDAQACVWQGDWAGANWTYFGNFYLKYDDVAPVIRPVNVRNGAVFVNDRKFMFVAKDETGDLTSFNGYLDGKWILFSQKKDTYTYHFDEHCTPGEHTLKVRAVDLAGNEKVYQCSIVNKSK